LDKLTAIRNKLRVGKIENKHMITASLYAEKTWTSIKKGMKAVGTEASETEEMARSFFKVLEQKLNLNNRSEPPTEEEVKRAIEQLKDVGRFSFFATMVILPGGVISLIGLELLAKKLGLKDYTLVPSSFRKKDDQDREKNRPDR
jgi:hypothetical protein